MTALCGGGASGPKVLPELAATYSAGRLAQLLVGAGLSELSAWLPLVGLIPVVYSSFCSTDPPAMVALTQAESDALANNTFGADFLNGLGKFKDVLLNLIWLDACQCTSGTLAPPTVPAVNVNTPVFIVPTQPNAVPCASTHFSSNFTSGGGAVVVSFPLQGNPFPTMIRVKITVTPVSGGGASGAWTLFSTQPPEAGGTLFSDTFNTGVGVQTRDLQFVPHPNTRFWSVGVNAGGAAGATSTFDTTLELWCSGQTPGMTQVPCCPPDVTTQAYLDLILKQVNLLQRRLAPIAYIPGATHSALSGQGSFVVDGLLGLKVHLTTVPASYGEQLGTPTFRFLDSWLSMMTPDGLIDERKIVSTDTVWTPRMATEATTWGYSFAPGIIADITELEPEP